MCDICVLMHVLYTYTHACFGHTLGTSRIEEGLVQHPSAPNNVLVVGGSATTRGAAHEGGSSTAQGKIKKITLTGTDGEALSN